MSIKKNVIKIIIGIIVAIAVIVGGIFAFKFISTNMKIKEAEEKLSQINVEELQTKLIKELESTPLNRNDNSYSTEFVKNKNGFVVANIVFTNERENFSATVKIPCFKIESYSNGKFKSITYWENDELLETVKEKIEKVFASEYGVDLLINGNSMYNRHFRMIGESQNIEITDEMSWAILYYEITEETPYGKKELYPAIIFGLDTKN